VIKKHIPNAITCGNLFCGCLAIIKCFEGNLVWAAYLVGIAAVLDFFDGFAARMLKVSSAIGKDLDSLADMVTFGVVPGLMMYKMIENSYKMENDFDDSMFWPKYIALIIPIFSCIRLAKFNNDTRQTESFIGLPTPANAMLICSFPLFINTNLSFHGCFGVSYAEQYLSNPEFLCALSILASFLLIAPIPMFSLKFKKFGWIGNKRRYSFLMFSVLLLIFLQFLAIPIIIVSYVLFSIASNLVLQNRPRSN
jgi:CDP-diacylglycerol--serine O-phosphatidyltransferase